MIDSKDKRRKMKTHWSKYTSAVCAATFLLPVNKNKTFHSHQEPQQCQCLSFSPPIYNNALLLPSRRQPHYSPHLLPPLSPSSELAGDASDWSPVASLPFKAPSRTAPLSPPLSWRETRFVLVFLVKDAWPPTPSIF